MSDSIRKELNPHDIARLFAEDVKRYADAVGSLDDLSATNVYNVLEGYEQEESMKDIERINKFETEFAKSEYLLSPENISKLANDMVDYYNSFIDDDVQIKILSDALKETETKLNNSLKAIQMRIINKSVADMFRPSRRTSRRWRTTSLGSKARLSQNHLQSMLSVPSFSCVSQHKA